MSGFNELKLSELVPLLADKYKKPVATIITDIIPAAETTPAVTAVISDPNPKLIKE